MRLLGIAVMVGLVVGVGRTFGDDPHAPVSAPVALGVLGVIALVGLAFDRVIMRR